MKAESERPKRQACHDCEHAEHVGPFKIWCSAGEGMMGDVYAAGMLTNGRCVKNAPGAKQ